MPAASRNHATQNTSLKLLFAGVALVLANQLSPAVPLAGAIALLAWGTALAVKHRRGWLLTTVGVYAVIEIFAIMAQVDLAIRSPSLAWGMLVAVDSAAGFTLLYSLVRKSGQMLADGLGAR